MPSRERQSHGPRFYWIPELARGRGFFLSAKTKLWALYCVAGWLLFWALGAAANSAVVRGQVLDGASGALLGGVRVELQPLSDGDATRVAVSDSAGVFRLLNMASGRWRLQVETMGYQTMVRELEVGAQERWLEIRLQVRPLLMDEMVVRARRPGAATRTAAFVEVIAVDDSQPGLDLPQILDQAVGVQVRRYGGLGSFSTVSIRGSTAEQVQVYLDGIPLNQAVGGGVNLGNVPLGGIERLEVYRGAVPGRFGGNSIGGIVHIRTREAGGERHYRSQASAGSFGTRQFSASGGGKRGELRYLGMVDYGESRNDFTFLDHNGTAFNTLDDEWTLRRNSDFHSFRTLAKVDRGWGRMRLQAHNTFDLSHRGIPGIGSFQAGHVRFDSWRNTTEVKVFGNAGQMGYRVVGYHLLQREEYKDLQGEVGLGVPQHERNTTRSFGTRTELSVLYRQILGTLFTGLRHERFAPQNLLQHQSRLFESSRRSVSLGLEVEVPLLDERLQIIGGGQLERNVDKFYGKTPFGTAALRPSRDEAKVLWGGRVGGQLELGRGWILQGHGGGYQRPPSFYELFGDRGAVIGNTGLHSEAGRNWDLGLVFRPLQSGTTGLLFAELVGYRNTVRNLIRFVHNSQLVSRPHNLGKGRIQGVETRLRFRVFSVGQLTGNYVYQVSTNQSPLSYEKGRDLPNAPRHVLNIRAALIGQLGEVHYELNQESRHFLDRANLRAVPRQLIHNIGGGKILSMGGEFAWEIRNLKASQVVDLWGYPLPGRSYFFSFKQDINNLFQ